MRILLVTRGVQGNIYPYLAIAAELKKRGHEVTINLPHIFETLAKTSNIPYILQDPEDMEFLMGKGFQKRYSTIFLIKWMKKAINMQFEQLPPLLEKHDILIACNTEFAAPSIAEFCGKPFIRTAFAPFIPGKHIPPPGLPFTNPNPLLPPGFLWTILNRLTNLSVLKTINTNRKGLGMDPVKNFGKHALHSSRNYLLYSRYLGNTDREWDADWKIGGYCFNDLIPYDKKVHTGLLKFIRQDNRPTIFFTLGSSKEKERNRLCEWLLHICKKEGYKLIVESGWGGTGIHLQENETFHLLTEPIPHQLLLPHCSAVVHHGGCGITHKAARAGIPQFAIPLILDQYYWGYRIGETGIGPKSIPISKLNQQKLYTQLTDLIQNDEYKANAEYISTKIKNENGLHNFYKYIERFAKLPQAVP